ncbi:MAG: hypothetical protein PVF83_08745 [Anaerolineales bacterium]|jgi:hypothetical protein
MKNTRIYLAVIGLSLFLLFLLQSTADKHIELIPNQTEFLFQDSGCTVMYASDEDVALAGNNEDYVNPFTQVWFLPHEEDKFGRVYFGFEGFLWQGGMNDQGLFFDATGVDQPVGISTEGKTKNDGGLPDKALAECADIDCVIDIFSNYYTLDTWTYQFMFGDAYGNSVIIEPNTFLRNEKSYQVVTNFYQSTTDIPTCASCTRYKTAAAMFEDTGNYSMELIRDILDAVHIDRGSPTLYSNVYDLKERLIYLYFFHDFDIAYVIDLEDELSQGYHAYNLADLFPPNQAYLDWAQDDLDGIASLRAAYQPVQVDPQVYEAYLGDYALPPELGLPFPSYQIDLLNGVFLLKMKSDKGWLELTPISETSFYHVSHLASFELAFLPDENGEVDRFIYKEDGEEYTFNRILANTVIEDTPTPSPTAAVIPTQAVTSSPLNGGQSSPSLTPYWWLLPTAALIGLAGWYLVRRSKDR